MLNIIMGKFYESTFSQSYISIIFDRIKAIAQIVRYALTFKFRAINIDKDEKTILGSL